MPQSVTPQHIPTSTTIKASVLRTTPVGLIVELADGREGLVRERELAWDTEARRGWRERYRTGDRVNIVSLSKESGRRPEFSVRLAQDDPWLNVRVRYPMGTLVDGAITGIMSYGVFVELEPGVTGLVHASRLPAWATAAPGEIFWPGDLVKVVVGEINIPERRMALSLADRAQWQWRQTDQTDATSAEARKGFETPQVADPVMRTSSLLQHSARSILVVDDNAAVRSEIGEWLRHVGHQVTLAEDGPSALVALRNIPTEVALIDVDLPQVTGMQVVQTIRQEWPETHCILMSGDHNLAENNDELLLLHRESVPILWKPFRPEELLEQLFGAPASEHTTTASSSRSEARQRTPQSHSQLIKVVRELWRATRVSLVVLFELDPAKRVIRIVEQHGRPVFETAALSALIHSPVRDVAEDGMVVRAADAEEAAAPRFRHLAKSMRFASCLGVPVSVTLPNRYALFLFSDQPDLAVNNTVDTFASASAIAAAAWLERDAFAQQAAELQRLVLLGQLGRTLVHEINNQAQNIQWAVKKLPDYVEQVNRQVETDMNRVRETLTEANQLLYEVSLEVNRLADIAKPFTSLTRLDHQSLLLLNVTVKEAVSVVSDAAQRANVALTIQDLPSNAFMRGQDTALHQVLVNVLLNAVQQIEQTRDRSGGHVVVGLTTSQDDGQPVYRISIEDDGPGIHRRLWERIFEMGYSTRLGGNGLGLYIARKLIEGMAGRIFVAKSRLGWGSTFVIELPR